MIISQDNHYLLYYKPDDSSPTQIRIEKNFSLRNTKQNKSNIFNHFLNLVNMWSDNKEVDVTYYNIHAEVGDQIFTSENSMIELTYKIITPFLREVKLKEIGV